MLKKSTFMIIAASIFLFSCNCGPDCGQQCCAPGTIKETVSVNETSKLAEAGALLIDVREADEVSEMGYDVSAIVNIPLDSLESNLNALPKEGQLILVCRSGNRSAQAFDILKSKGFENISNMDKGIIVWEEAGFPVNKGGYAPFNLSDYQPAKCGKAGKACCNGKKGKCCKGDAKSCKKTADISGSNSESAGFASLNRSEQPATTQTGDGMLEVIKFHSEHRCMTCLKIEELTKETVNGLTDVTFRLVNADDKKNEKEAEKFRAYGTALFLYNPATEKKKDLTDFAFMNARDKDKFIKELKRQIGEFEN